jgi:cell division protein ZapE
VDPWPRELDIQGRKLPVERSADGVGWFDFRTLCDADRGAPDYLAIARRFHTVFLSDIEKLTPKRRDIAARFVTLIDSLYEHKCKVICSAEAAPEKLYPAGDGAFEFQRTVSRLMEMQSEDYLAAPHLVTGEPAAAALTTSAPPAPGANPSRR